MERSPNPDVAALTLGLAERFAHSTAARPPKRSCRRTTAWVAGRLSSLGYYLKHGDEMAGYFQQRVLATECFDNDIIPGLLRPPSDPDILLAASTSAVVHCHSRRAAV